MYSLLLRPGTELLMDTCGQRSLGSLLLVYLLVAKASADCTKPEDRENIVLTNEALLMNDFPEGTNVTLECANGYVIDSGIGVITCMDDEWTEPNLICKRKDCGHPRTQPNMIFDLSKGTLFGDVITITCETGYQISGSSYKQCFAGGWSGRAKCTIVECEAPPKVTNGAVSWTTEETPTYGDSIQYTCNEGYILTGNNTITCTETGEYDSQPPECKGVATEDRVTTKTVPTPTSLSREASTPPPSSATPTTRRDTPITTRTTTSPSPFVEEGGKGIMTEKDKATTASVISTTSSSLQDIYEGDMDTNRGVDHVPVIISVISVFIVCCIIVLLIHKLLLRKKGSYDTGEDLKPELLQFQNL